MDGPNTDRFSEGHSDQNEMHGIREPTLGDCWRPVMNEEYLGIQHQPIDANNLKPTLISIVTPHPPPRRTMGASHGNEIPLPDF